jgi:toluene monooxygenase system ferredoxin subunit
MAFVRAVREADLWGGELTACEVDGVRILLCKLADGLVAYADRCPHQGIPLTAGRLEGEVLTCTVHGWQFDLRTGQGINPRNARLRQVPVKVVAGEILVDVSGVGSGYGTVEPDPEFIASVERLLRGRR